MPAPVLPTGLLADDDQPTAHVSLAVTPPPRTVARFGASAVGRGHCHPADADEYPAVGTAFGDYQLDEELGRGAFARVYLARERRLADRPVALKVSVAANNECRRLAQLQHTNIVPIHTAFQLGRHHVVQMPFFGRQTLADLIDAVRATNQFPLVSGEVFTTVARLSTAGGSGRHRPVGTTMVAADTATRTAPATPAAPRPAAPEVHPLRAQFAGTSYVDAVLWLAGRLADGLAHAHARGILHLDLKPQNVLVADDGQPMLLDFNLASDTKTRDRERIGGTWPYMAPEQIEEYAGTGTRPVDERSDLFGLGVILYELLTLRHPFPAMRPGPDGLAAAVAARNAGGVAVRPHNPAVPASVEAVVRKLLAPDPADRYQTADQLRADLRRHAEHRPLRHAPDRSPAERFGKWRRRNPRAVPTGVAATAVALLVGGGLLWADNDREGRRRAAADRAAAVRAALPGLRADLAVPGPDAETAPAAVRTVRGWVDEFAADRPGWADRGGLRLLAADERSALTAAVGEAALLAAQAEWQAPGDRAAAGRRATELLAAAGTCYAPADAPAAIADMVSLVNGKPAADRDTGGPVDGFATAARLMAAGRYEDAAARFEGHVRGQPGDYAGQLALGVCYARLGRPVQAAERLAAAAPLAPANDPRPAFHRGTALLAAGRAEAAEAEFTAALAVRPKWHPALHHRGVARLRRHAYRPAVDDLSDALAAGGPKLPLLVVRAAAHELMGNADEAERDRAAVDRTEAVTAVDFTVRGLRLAKTDPDRAGEAYARALELDPRWLPAQQNLAALADQRGRPAEAEAAARKAAEMAPQYAPARIGLAVLLARAGRRDEAHEAARAAVLLGDDPGVLFQAAAVYARTSRTHPGDRATALDHLRRAVRQGFTESLALERDEDLDALRSLPEFAEILRAVKALAP